MFFSFPVIQNDKILKFFRIVFVSSLATFVFLPNYSASFGSYFDDHDDKGGPKFGEPDDVIIEGSLPNKQILKVNTSYLLED